jgi:CspA family cold shock protein
MAERGRVKWFNNRTGWGFIERSDGSDVYVHHDQIEGQGYKSLRAGEIVEFSVRKGRRGLFAEKVVCVEQAAERR